MARIADGDYTSAVDVRSRDELGRLAISVNRMRDNIRAYTTEIQGARARLDSAVERVSGVSRALTTTTGGMEALHAEVVRTAADIAGEGAVAALAVEEAGVLVVKAVHPESSPLTDLSRWKTVRQVLRLVVILLWSIVLYIPLIRMMAPEAFKELMRRLEAIFRGKAGKMIVPSAAVVVAAVGAQQN